MPGRVGAAVFVGEKERHHVNVAHRDMGKDLANVAVDGMLNRHHNLFRDAEQARAGLHARRRQPTHKKEAIMHAPARAPLQRCRVGRDRGRDP